MIKARKTEMELFKKMAVYRKVPQLVKKRRAGSTRTRDAALSLEACRHGNQEGQASGSVLLVADCAKGQRQAKLLRSGIFGVNRAYFYAPMTRPLCIKIPDEDWEERDAAQKWAATNTKFMVKIGFQRGRALNCNFVHKKRNIKMTVHGDDFLAVADLDQIKWIEEQLKSEYGIKAEVLRS